MYLNGRDDKGNFMYEWKTRIRYSEVGTDGLLTMCSLIDYFQDCVNLDSDDRKVGYWELSKKGLGWILLTWQIEVNRYPKMGETVVISTAPHGFRGTFGYRNFFMRDEEGELLAASMNSSSICKTPSRFSATAIISRNMALPMPRFQNFLVRPMATLQR